MTFGHTLSVTNVGGKARQPSQADGVQWNRQKGQELAALHTPKEVQWLQCLELMPRLVCVELPSDTVPVCPMDMGAAALPALWMRPHKAPVGTPTPALTQQIQAWLRNRSAFLYSCAIQCLSG